MSFRILIPIVFLMFWSAPVFAQTEEPTAIVLGLTMVDGDDEISREMTMALRMALLEHGGLDISDRLVAGESMVLVNECDDLDDACLPRIAALLNEQYVFYGTVRRSTSTDMSAGFIVTVSLFDAGSAHTISHAEDHLAFPLGEGEMIASGRRIIQRLFEGQTLYVAVPPPATTIVTPPVTPPVPAVVRDRPDWAPIGWTLVGIAGAAFIADIAIWTRIGDLNHDEGFHELRTGAPIGTNVCIGASGRNADICSEADALEIAQFIMLGLSIASAGVGSILLILQSVSSRTGESDIALRPSISSTSASLSIAGTF